MKPGFVNSYQQGLKEVTIFRRRWYEAWTLCQATDDL